jgi:hypothetical protein
MEMERVGAGGCDWMSFPPLANHAQKQPTRTRSFTASIMVHHGP